MSARRGSRHNLSRAEWLVSARLYALRGEELPHSRLTESAVRAIRAAYGPKTARELAAEYGVKVRTIESVVSGERWGHVT